eukprot:193792-Hanusia_phi.AAC.1
MSSRRPPAAPVTARPGPGRRYPVTVMASDSVWGPAAPPRPRQPPCDGPGTLVADGLLSVSSPTAW